MTEKNPAAVALGLLGGARGGYARAAKLTPEERTAIARKAASARWGSQSKTHATIPQPAPPKRQQDIWACRYLASLADDMLATLIDEEALSEFEQLAPSEKAWRIESLRRLASKLRAHADTIAESHPARV